MSAKEFLYNLQDEVDPKVLDDKESNFHFDLAGDGGGEFTVEVRDGKLTVTEGHNGEATCTVRGKSTNFMKVVNGELKPLNALLFGKIKVSNQGELIKYARIFGLMK